MDLMHKADDAKGEAILAVQQMRNIIVASSLMVMGMGQIQGRLVSIMVTDSNLVTIAELARQDPITGPNPGWASPQAKVAVPFAATLLSLLCFGQAVRLAVHLGFLIRVKGVYKHTDLPLREEIVAMTERCSLYFTCGLRSLYLFIAMVWWMLGTTALLIGNVVVLLLLAWSDRVHVKDASREASMAATDGTTELGDGLM